MFHLTDEGVMQLAKFEQCATLIRTAYDGLFAEVGDVRQLVDRAANALNKKSLDQRMLLG